jgi:capsular polysaccharide biosynthesis protein
MFFRRLEEGKSTHRQERFNLLVSYRRWRHNLIGSLFRALEFLFFKQPLQTLVITRPGHDFSKDGYSWKFYNYVLADLRSGFFKLESNQVVAPYLVERNIMSGNYFSDILRLTKNKKSELVQGTTFIIPKQEYYFHFIVEWVPRIILIRDNFPDVTFISRPNAKFVADLFRTLKVNLHVVSTEIVSVKSFLVFENLQNLQHKVALIRDNLIGFGNASQVSAVLFLTRRGYGRFDLDLEDKIMGQLPPTFQSYDPGSYGIEEQIGRFATSRELHGLHGGGLTNMIFMQPGSLVVEYFTPHIRSSCYQELAVASGLHYRSVDVG